jgi:thioredoxin-like negative regulator of GroEL
MIISVNKNNFQTEVLNSARPVLVNFWHYGNSQCRDMKRLFYKLAETLDSNYVVAEVDWQREKELASRYRVFGIPALLIFEQGSLIGRYSGIIRYSELLESLDVQEVVN